jgi:putative transposase
MTLPRQLLPGVTYLVTRRCFQRQFLLCPSPLTNQLLAYLLALSAQRFGIQLHAYCFLSNHFHLVLTDPRACLPAFSQYLDSLIARAQNGSLGRFESFWAPSSYSAVALVRAEDIVDKSAYVLANPVAAGLVHRGGDWPGLCSRVGQGPLGLSRPEAFFRSRGCMPEQVRLELFCPPGFESAEEFGRRLTEALELREQKAREELKGRQVLGVRGVLSQRAMGGPATQEPRGRLRPRVGCRDKWRRVEALGRLRSFLEEYRVAWNAFRRGSREVLFPAGTYWMRVVQGVRCAAPG